MLSGFFNKGLIKVRKNESKVLKIKKIIEKMAFCFMLGPYWLIWAPTFSLNKTSCLIEFF